MKAIGHVRTLEGVSVLNDEPAAAVEFGLDRNAGVLLYEEDDEKITVELDEMAMTVLLQRVLPSIPLQKTTTKTEDEAEEDDPRLCGLSLIDFANTRPCLDRILTPAFCLVWPRLSNSFASGGQYGTVLAASSGTIVFPIINW
ncbi:hypothetical protein BKA82DRAFT_4017296 [Pisolithus tinctorius]|nr:hypothetical protein BKA82DRAFT_4017296 [Pisolithus tinctorius]